MSQKQCWLEPQVQIPAAPQDGTPTDGSESSYKHDTGMHNQMAATELVYGLDGDQFVGFSKRRLRSRKLEEKIRRRHALNGLRTRNLTNYTNNPQDRPQTLAPTMRVTGILVLQRQSILIDQD